MCKGIHDALNMGLTRTFDAIQLRLTVFLMGDGTWWYLNLFGLLVLGLGAGIRAVRDQTGMLLPRPYQTSIRVD
jgi:uncharacterized membrane protein YesL